MVVVHTAFPGSTPGTLKQNPTAAREKRIAQMRHLEHLKELGRRDRGLKEQQAPAEHLHVHQNAKRAMARRQLQRQTVAENALLLTKMHGTINRTSEQQDKQVQQSRINFNNVYAAAQARRRAKQRQLDSENSKFARRLLAAQSSYKPGVLEKVWPAPHMRPARLAGRSEH